MTHFEVLRSRRFLYAFAGIFLFISWMAPPLSWAWEWLDARLFFALNGSLAWGDGWQRLWAVANTRLIDVPVAILYLILCAWYCLDGRGKHAASRAARILVMLVAFVALRFVVDVFFDGIDYRRESPTRVLQPALMLSELQPGLHAKDSSKFSFPGDHGLVAFWMLLYFWVSSAPRFRWAALSLALLAAIPRLFSGAHWASDLFVGSLGCALIGYAVVASGAWYPWAVGRAEPVLRRIADPVCRRLFPSPAPVSSLTPQPVSDSGK
ncbi:MAG: phosphatase PAP2 family protein [Candidatus Sumerlaeia bacterium]|nr:phosphatase PAP2 family protein [Candidatus Sumerlaeia bacterium]